MMTQYNKLLITKTIIFDFNYHKLTFLCANAKKHFFISVAKLLVRYAINDKVNCGVAGAEPNAKLKPKQVVDKKNLR